MYVDIHVLQMIVHMLINNADDSMYYLHNTCKLPERRAEILREDKSRVPL